MCFFYLHLHAMDPSDSPQVQSLLTSLLTGMATDPLYPKLTSMATDLLYPNTFSSNEWARTRIST